MIQLFPGQQANEEIIIVLREHWLYLLGRVLLWLIFLLALLLFNIFAPNLLPALFQDPYVYYVGIFRIMFMMFVALGIFISWVMYYLNIQIITSERIVDVSQTSLFNHTISELTYDAIEDVTGETKGLLGTIFSFGNVYVQTAAEKERFEFKNVPNPERVEKLILDTSQIKKNTARSAAPAEPSEHSNI